jgi:hypothetical protein
VINSESTLNDNNKLIFVSHVSSGDVTASSLTPSDPAPTWTNGPSNRVLSCAAASAFVDVLGGVVQMTSPLAQKKQEKNCCVSFF